MKKLKDFTKADLEKISQFSSKWKDSKTKKVRYYLNTIKILEYYGNVFKLENNDYDLFLNYKIWIEDKELFTDSKNKTILLKVSNNIHKILELNFWKTKITIKRRFHYEKERFYNYWTTDNHVLYFP